MIPNPILKVLSTFQKNNVKALLIGGQACVIYGAAEFSRDSDFVVLLDLNNLKNLKKALRNLKAKQIYVPPLDIDYLKRGHACHFRCALDEVKDLRIDIMAKLRGCSPFSELWERRKIINLGKNIKTNLISLEDLVQCKKTQRDKDWFMLKRLVEINIMKNKLKSNIKKKKWWFYECRTPELLVELAQKFPNIVKNCLGKRHLLKYAIKEDIDKLSLLLQEEEKIERYEDRLYWVPLRKELEKLRREKAIK